MSEDQKYCIQVLQAWAGGAHHLPKIYDWGSGVCVNWSGGVATFDWDGLTRLVLLAHKFLVRVEVSWSGPGLVRIICHRRKASGSISQRHPSLDDLVKRIEGLKGDVLLS